METRKEKKPVTVTPVPEQPGIVSALASAAYNATVGTLLGGPKSEVNIIAFFYDRYGCFDDQELDVIGNFNNAMTKFKDKIYLYHQIQENKEREIAYSKLAPTAKEELQGIYFSLVTLAKEKKADIKEIDISTYTLGQLSKLIRELIDKQFSKPKEEAKKLPIPKEKKEYFYVAKAQQNFLIEENKLEEKAKTLYNASHTLIDGYGEPIIAAANELEQKTLDLKSNINKGGQVEANLARFKKFEEARDHAQKLLKEFKNTEGVANEMISKFENQYKKEMAVIAKELKKPSMEDKINEWHTDLQGAVTRATQFESQNQSKLGRLKNAVDSYNVQLELARDLLTNLQESLSPQRLINYWPTQCYTFLGRGGRQLNVGDRTVRVPHGIAAMVQGIPNQQPTLLSLTPQTMTLKEIKNILTHFKRIVLERREARSDTSFFGKIQVRQTPTCNLYDRLAKLDIENIKDQNVQGLEFNAIQALPTPSQPVEIQMQDVVSDKFMEQKYS